MSSTPQNEPLRFVGTSDGELVPAGQFLFVLWPDGSATLAHRDSPATSLTWSPPLELEVAP